MKMKMFHHKSITNEFLRNRVQVTDHKTFRSTLHANNVLILFCNIIQSISNVSS